jgi:hypothetical protein
MMRTLIAIAAFIFYVGLNALPVRADFMNGNILAGLCASEAEGNLAGALVTSLVLQMPSTIDTGQAPAASMAGNIASLIRLPEKR